MLLKNAFTLLFLTVVSLSAHAKDYTQEVNTCKKELKKSNFFFSGAVGVECMDLFFMHPELNQPSGSFNFVSEFGEKIIVKQPDNMNMYFSVFYIYYSQWRLAVVEGEQFSIYANRMTTAMKLMNTAEKRFGPTEAFLEGKASSFYSIALYYMPQLRAEVIATYEKLDRVTKEVRIKIKSRNAISEIYEANLEIQKAIDTLKTILVLAPNRQTTLKKIKQLEEKLEASKK